MQNLELLGISHNTAPVEIREKFSVSDSKFLDTLSSIKCIPGVIECVLVSTCNRMEIYLYLDNMCKPENRLVDFISKLSGVDNTDIKKYTYSLSGVDAGKHLMKVSSGLDSMMLGENQILGQLKESYKKSRDAKFSGPMLNTLFNRAISAGKRARSETEISRGAVSVSAAAVEMAFKIFEDLSNKKILIIGAGKMSELAAKQLLSYGIKTVLVSNRTYEKAKELADKFGGSAVRFDEINKYLQTVDIVISSTGSPHLLIKKEDMEPIIHKRSGNPIFFIDIAVPRDIDPKISELEDVFLYDIDDLGLVVKENIKDREATIPKVEKIIADEINKFVAWYDSRNKYKVAKEDEEK